MALFERMKATLAQSRKRLRESLNILLDAGPEVDDDFWDDLEETLILSDIGATAAAKIVGELREDAKRAAMPDAASVIAELERRIADTFFTSDSRLLNQRPLCVLFVGVNGSGKTTTIGKFAAKAVAQGSNVVLGAADTFRAAAIEQLGEWARRSGAAIVARERGSDPASVCYETIGVAERNEADLVLIDTAGRLHTSDDLMRELRKVCDVVRKRSKVSVVTVLVIDATTGQNGLSQARVFNDFLDIDGMIITKLDGTAKGGIALAISHELRIPVLKIGMGEGLEDLQDFDPHDFARALVDHE